MVRRLVRPLRRSTSCVRSSNRLCGREPIARTKTVSRHFAFYKFNQIQRIKVKRRCQRATTAGAPVMYLQKVGLKEDDHAEILFSLVELRRVPR